MIEIAGREVGRIGYGTMQLAGPGAMGRPTDERRAMAAIRAAVDAGVRLIDTSGYYGPAVANELVARALRPYPKDLLIATKVGAKRTSTGGFAAASRPEEVREAVLDNLRQLQVESLHLVHARYMPDTTVPFAETVAALVQLRDEGFIEHVGISNVTVDLLREASEVTAVASVENELRLGHAIGREVLDATTRAGIPFLAYRPLGNGALAAPSSPLASLARVSGIAAATLALTWLLDQAPNVAVIPGTANPAHVGELVAAETAKLDDEVRAALDALGGA
ncbi:aldo/keto reductase [Dactylosporangium fulvum]|uniref:Aldo/keto reductase n=1 Tax=Dactylosporangium fulvum TaxID=53359 RepID=A0ABY5WB58_9ACTN|nr:aldo/keto reductase [Dactylosporangium fulvum]UWP86464.1 aldo/keto reductase [Dactylosporangium fulvum]